MNRLLRNNKWTTITVVVFTLLFLGALATKCHAQDAIAFSAGSPMARGETPAVDLSFRFDSQRDAYWQVSLTLIGESTYENEYQPNNAGLQALYVDGFGPVDFGLGVAFLQNVDRYNGSHANFALQLGYNFTLFGVPGCVQYRHWSNAGTRKPNLGRDLLFVGWRF